MGLKNTNYKINGYVYPEVYAVFNGNIRKLGNEYEVAFDIHANRELALHEQPLEVKKVRVKVEDWDRKCDLVAFAYQKGKEKIKHTYDNPVTRRTEEVFIDGKFTGWLDDIQE